MTLVSGQLMVDRGREHLAALADHLRRREGVIVRVYDANNRVVLDSATEPRGCGFDGSNCEQFLEQTCASCRESESTRCVTCPRGRGVQVHPIRRSSVYFGTLIACGTGEGADRPGRSTGAVLDAMLDLLADGSSREHEIDSLATELALRYEEIELLYELDEKIPLRTHTSRVIEYVADKSFTVINCTCLAWVGGPSALPGLATECRVFWNPKTPAPPPMLRLEAEQLARTLAERALRKGEPQVITSLDADAELSAFASELNAVLCLPMSVQNDLYGCFVAFKPRGEQFTSYELKIMTSLARKGAFAIRDSQLYEDLDSLFFNLIRLLVFTIENKDEYTKGHSQRVRTFTVRLAELAGLEKAEVETLNLSGLLHDIGKQGIPDAVLKKEGKLTDEERALINTHPIRGVNLIKHIKQFEKCLPHIRHHHERMDGKGYPDGLVGDQIPQGARIIAVADTYDALTSDRCYRPRFTLEKAFDIIRDVSGTQLDVGIARLLVEHHEEFGAQSQQAQARSGVAASAVSLP